MTIIENQEDFFNKNALMTKKTLDVNNFFHDSYVFKELKNGFYWLNDQKNILDYGCGSGQTIDLFLKFNHGFHGKICGVDIAEEAINCAKKDFPNYTFLKIFDNKIPEKKDESFDGCYIVHVLHHSRNHQEMFNEIHRVLEKNGKLFICDLSSNNFLVRLGRLCFNIMPGFIKNKFHNDLVVDGNIPQKYKVNIPLVLKQLSKSGFEIQEVGYGHLFIFLFSWPAIVFGMFDSKIFKKILPSLFKIENFLLKFKFFKKRSELFYIKCTKG